MDFETVQNNQAVREMGLFTQQGAPFQLKT